jgi:CobQ-like glutamine amidotransferase family enzyme
MKIIIAYLYPNEMNIYGDRGNVIVLKKRLEWRGYQVVVEEIEPRRMYDFNKADIIFGGGGQDRGQSQIAADLQKRSKNINLAIKKGLVALTICGTYQLFGAGFITASGEKIPGIGIFKAVTVASQKRMIGNVVINSTIEELVGFENHSGQTTLEIDQPALGKVVKGHGNNSQDKTEGAISLNAYGTYLHGPVLSKNPKFADELIKRALQRRGIQRIAPLDDSIEREAALRAKQRP